MTSLIKATSCIAALLAISGTAAIADPVQVTSSPTAGTAVTLNKGADGKLQLETDRRFDLVSGSNGKWDLVQAKASVQHQDAPRHGLHLDADGRLSLPKQAN